MTMRFAHMADCHLGSWSSHPELRELPLKAFEKAMDMCIGEGVDFVLIAGDLFDTSFPPIDILRSAVRKMKECCDCGIAIYAIAGSHDFSPTGKTFISVLEEAGLLKNVAKSESVDGRLRLLFTTDHKTGAKICGIAGKAGALEKENFALLDRDIEQEDGFKIFVLHSAVSGCNAGHAQGVAASLLPRGFDYYASGHVHERFEGNLGSGKIAFPGCLFPSDFSELENYESGFYIVDVGDSINLDYKSVRVCEPVMIGIDASKKTADRIEGEILGKIENADLKGKILLIKISGVLESGKPSDVDFKAATSRAYERGAAAVKKNTSHLTTREFEEVRIKPNVMIDELERDLIKEHAESMKLSSGNGEELTIALMKILMEQKQEGETASSYEGRIIAAAKEAMHV